MNCVIDGVNITLHEAKTYQYRLIATAGLAVTEQKEMSLPLIHNSMDEQFKELIEHCLPLPGHLKGLDPNIFHRSKKLFEKQALIDTVDMHTGESLWRKYLEIKSKVVNVISKALSDLLINDELPSGEKLIAAKLMLVRKQIWEDNEELSKKNSKAKKGYTKQPFMMTWYPLEWDVFMLYGRPSNAPEEVFLIRLICHYLIWCCNVMV